MPHYTLPFNPVPGLSSGYWQTIFGYYGFHLSPPPSVPMIIPVSDDDRLFCLDSTPPEWNPNLPTIILTHGLGGSSNSRYMLRLSRYLYIKGQRVIRVNFRGCGPGEGLARKPSHAGRSDDLLAVCKMLKIQFPHSDIKIVGFSLSGNIVLKMLGELGVHAADLVERALTICPLVDLKAGSIFISKPEKRLFENSYLEGLKEIVARKKKIYPDYPNISFPKTMSLYTFDDLYTAPLSGFQNAEEYYELCSSNPIVHKIAIPTKILYSLDDPIIPAKTIEELQLSPSVTTYATKHGGHVGFLGWAGPDFWLRWMDRRVVKWLNCSIND